MSYRLLSSHTFNSHSIEEGRFATPQDAWRAAAEDYAETDAGLDLDAQMADVEVMANRRRPEVHVTSEGECGGIVGSLYAPKYLQALERRQTQWTLTQRSRS